MSIDTTNGNMTSDSTHSYAWDARNRLTSMDFGNTASFSYDPFGRRVSKNIVGTSTNFLYDGANPVQELSGTTPSANLLSGGIDEVFTRTDSAGARSFLTDALGSTLALTDSTGATQTSYTFDPFGNTTSGGSSTTNTFAYTGRELDATGLYYYRARYYNSAVQRFISEDPLDFKDGITTYSYARNNPIQYVDPTGRCIWGFGWLCGWYKSEQIRNEFEGDKSIFDITGRFMDPMVMMNAQGGVEFAEINQIEQWNQLIDLARQGNLSAALLEHYPELLGKIDEQLADLLEQLRDTNIHRVDQLLQQIARIQLQGRY